MLINVYRTQRNKTAYCRSLNIVQVTLTNSLTEIAFMLLVTDLQVINIFSFNNTCLKLQICP